MSRTGKYLAMARLVTGLIMFTYVTWHLCNHALGLISLDAMEAMLRLSIAIWRSPPGTWLLAGSILTHLALAFYALWRRRTLKMPLKDAVQITAGILLAMLLAQHIAGTRFAALYGGEIGYRAELTRFFVLSPDRGIEQAVLLILVWLHACIGLHGRLSLRPWWKRWARFYEISAFLLPTLALLGMWVAGRQIQTLAADPAWMAETRHLANIPPDGGAHLDAVRDVMIFIAAGILAAVLAGRKMRAWLRRNHSVSLTYPDGKVINAACGSTVLEASRVAGIPHTSICGGRGRCSTCRVRIVAGLESLPAPAAIEAAVLKRIGNPKAVRLACQIRPTQDLSLVPLVSPEGDRRAHSALEKSVEREVAILFCDLRSFTRISEGRLPYDIVFMLNCYFQGMTRAIEEQGGYLDKFIGDGIMALFGLDGGAAQGCKDAIAAAAAMGRNLQALNEIMHAELGEDLKIGIGIHCGHAVVGQMGAGRAISLTAIGDSVNVASRLESMTKEFGAELIVSESTAHLAGLNPTLSTRKLVEIRGREQPLPVRVVSRLSLL